MQLRLGTTLGTELGTRLGLDGEVAYIEAYLARNLFSWFRADSRTDVAGSVNAWNDRVALSSEGAVVANARAVSASHALLQASAPLQAVASLDATTNRDVITFGGTAQYDSSIAAANWKFLHDGTGCEAWFIIKPGSTTAGTLFATFRGQDILTNVGINLFIGPTSVPPRTVLAIARNASPGAVNTPDITSTYAVGTPTMVRCSYLSGGSPDYEIRQPDTLIGSGSQAGAPSTADPTSTLRVGANGVTGDRKYVGGIYDILLAAQRSAGLRAAVARYAFLRYGVS